VSSSAILSFVAGLLSVYNALISVWYLYVVRPPNFEALDSHLVVFGVIGTVYLGIFEALRFVVSPATLARWFAETQESGGATHAEAARPYPMDPDILHTDATRAKVGSRARSGAQPGQFRLPGLD
jgi:hypothetical protein